VNLPSTAAFLAAFFAAAPEPEPDQIVFGPCDQPVPYTLTAAAEALLDAEPAAGAEPEPEAEL
jgi:hypothetical protein